MANKLNDIEIRSESVRDILTKVPPWPIRWGNVLFFVLVISILILSWLIEYPDIIEAEAVLTTKIPPQKEYARVSAQLDTLFVKDKQNVSKNQVLAILENTANYGDVFILKKVLDTSSMGKFHISFPFEKLPILFLGEIEPDFAKFENSYFQYIINKDLKPFESESIANKISVSELKRRLQSVSAQREISKSELSYKKMDLDRNQKLFDKGVISMQELENKQLEYYTSLRNYQNMGVSESQLREFISAAEKTSKGTEYNKSREETRLLKGVLQSYNGLKKALKDWELKYTLKSNIDGKVSFLEFWSKNQNVNSGDLVFTILPKETSDYLVKLDVHAKNTGKIMVGQRVNVSLWDFPEYEFGVLTGRVEQISGISDERGVYKIDVSLPNKLLTSYGKEIVFKQEMKGTAQVITEDLRLIERLFYEFRQATRR